MKILEHELSPYPLSLARIDGTINTCSKSDMLHDLGLHVPNTIPDGEHESCVIIDGHALIQSPGKPAACKTFIQRYLKVVQVNILLHQ